MSLNVTNLRVDNNPLFASYYENELKNSQAIIEKLTSELKATKKELKAYQTLCINRKELANSLKQRIKELESSPLTKMASRARIQGIERLSLMVTQVLISSYPHGVQIGQIASIINPELSVPLKEPYYQLKSILDYLVEVGAATHQSRSHFYFYNPDLIYSAD